MTLPTSDAQPSRALPRRLKATPLTHSMPVNSSPTLLPTTPPHAAVVSDQATHHKHAIDFATHSLDLATGGFKTLTAKRELPTQLIHRTTDTMPDLALSSSYTVTLIILLCVVLMLIGGGVVLFSMLQP